MSSFQENQQWETNEEERDLDEEALSLSDLPITTTSTAGNEENDTRVEEDPRNEEDTNFDFAFDSLVESVSAVDRDMCAADEVFSGGQILPYRNSVSSMTELRSFSRSESMDRRGFGSRSNTSSRSSSIRSHYSAASSSSGGSSCSNITAMSAKTIPMVSKTKVQNQFHSYPSPKPQILGSGTRVSTHASPIGKKSKMWEVLKLGLVRTPEIELQDLKIRHNRSNNLGKSLKFPRNSSSNRNNSSNDNNNDQARKSFSNEGHKISDFVLETQKRRSKQYLSENKNGGFFKSCKCSIGVIDPLPTRPNYYYYYGDKSSTSSYVGISPNKQGHIQHNLSASQVTNEDKKSAQKKQEEHKRNSQIRQDKQVMSHHHQNRTFEWLKNLSHASVLNS